jgi:hypothetical protein
LFCFLVYRKAFDLCMLILHFVALLCLPDQIAFLVESLGSFKHRNISLVNRDNLTFSFLIYISLISFPCPIALVHNSSIILNKSGESGHFCLISEFKGNGFRFFLFC